MMKWTLAQALAICLLFCLFHNTLIAQASSPGAMPNDTLFICDAIGILRVQNDHTESIQAGDALNYVIEDEAEDVLIVSSDGVFEWEHLLDTLRFSEGNCDEFIVYAVAGQANAMGWVQDIGRAAKSNAQLLVTFGIGIPLDTSAPEPVTIPLEAGSEVAMISPPCEGLLANSLYEKSVACDYACPCMDTVYVTSYDTIQATWYVLAADSTNIRIQGDTIFRHIPNPSNPTATATHIDTIIISSISDENASIQVQNAQNAIAATSFQLDFQPFEIIPNFIEGEAIIDTLFVANCKEGVGNTCGFLAINVTYTANCFPCCETIPEVSRFEEVPVFCIGDSILLEARQVEGASYIWNTGDTTTTILATQGFYAVTITNECAEFIQSDSLRANATPTYANMEKSCSYERQTYKVSLNLIQAVVESINKGELANPQHDKVIIKNIPLTDTLQFSLRHPLSNCVLSYTVYPPPSCNPPVGLAVNNCEGEAQKPLVAHSDEQTTIDWFSSARGQDMPPLPSGNEFLPNMSGTYYAQTRYLESGFVVEERTPIAWQVVAAPSLRATQAALIDCEKKDGMLELNVSGTNTPYSLYWLPKANSQAEVRKLAENHWAIHQLTIGKYPLELTDKFGCIYQDTVAVKHDPELCDKFFLPTAFSPNGDGNNDSFKVEVADGFDKLIRVQIFDRTGRLIFATADDNPLNGINLVAWDGTFRGKALNPGFYMCTVEIRRASGRVIIYREEGVNLMR